MFGHFSTSCMKELTLYEAAFSDAFVKGRLGKREKVKLLWNLSTEQSRNLKLANNIERHLQFPIILLTVVRYVIQNSVKKEKNKGKTLIRYVKRNLWSAKEKWLIKILKWVDEIILQKGKESLYNVFPILVLHWYVPNNKKSLHLIDLGLEL